jgi:hypothetical protein
MKADPRVAETVAAYVHEASQRSWRLPAEWRCAHCQQAFPADRDFVKEPHATVRAHLEACTMEPRRPWKTRAIIFFVVVVILCLLFAAA